MIIVWAYSLFTTFFSKVEKKNNIIKIHVDKQKANLAIITSHCDTPDKIDSLKGLIKQLKNLNIDILLYSHLHLDTSIQQEVTYYIYDKDNPILYWPERGCLVWFEVAHGKDSVKLTSMFPDYGWTVFDQLKKSASFALPLKYDYYSFICYDVILTPELDSCLLDPPCPITAVPRTGYGDQDAPEDFDVKSLSTAFAMLRQDFLEKVNARINKTDYLNHKSPENYWHTLLSAYPYFVLPSGIDNIATAHKVTPNQNYFNDNFKVFFQNGNIPDKPHLTKAYFFDVKDNISIEIKCNSQNHLIEKASILDLPTNVTTLGFWDKDTYCDFLPELDKAKAQYHSIVRHK